MSRLKQRFAQLKEQNRAALVTFLTAGDPDYDTASAILQELPAAGADIIELGMPFTDPMADGPAIQLSSLRALAKGQNVAKTLKMVGEFRQKDNDTPIVLMGYFNPIHQYGVERFVADAATAGVDGLIVVDLPAEHDRDLCIPAAKGGIDFIRLTTPTSHDERLQRILGNASGFVYYVSVAGTTGAGSATVEHVQQAVDRIRKYTPLPVSVGFGIRTPEQAANIARVADGVVVGSALVQKIAEAGDGAQAKAGVLGLCKDLAGAVRKARAQSTSDAATA